MAHTKVLTSEKRNNATLSVESSRLVKYSANIYYMEVSDLNVRILYIASLVSKLPFQAPEDCLSSSSHLHPETHSALSALSSVKKQAPLEGPKLPAKLLRNWKLLGHGKHADIKLCFSLSGRFWFQQHRGRSLRIESNHAKGWEEGLCFLHKNDASFFLGLSGKSLQCQEPAAAMCTAVSMVSFTI